MPARGLTVRSLSRGTRMQNASTKLLERVTAFAESFAGWNLLSLPPQEFYDRSSENPPTSDELAGHHPSWRLLPESERTAV